MKLLFALLLLGLAGCSTVDPQRWGATPPEVLHVRQPITVKCDAFALGHVTIPAGEYRFWKRGSDGLVYVAEGVKLVYYDMSKREEFEGGIMLVLGMDSVNPVRIYHDDKALTGGGELPRYFLHKNLERDGFLALFAGRGISAADRAALGLPAKGSKAAQ